MGECSHAAKPNTNYQLQMIHLTLSLSFINCIQALWAKEPTYFPANNDTPSPCLLKILAVGFRLFHLYYDIY